jgi:hypothetical protein
MDRIALVTNTFLWSLTRMYGMSSYFPRKKDTEGELLSILSDLWDGNESDGRRALSWRFPMITITAVFTCAFVIWPSDRRGVAFEYAAKITVRMAQRWIGNIPEALPLLWGVPLPSVQGMPIDADGICSFRTPIFPNLCD